MRQSAEHEAYIDDYISKFVKTDVIGDKFPDFNAYLKTSGFAEHRLRFIETYINIINYVKLSGKCICEAGHLSGLSQWLASEGEDVSQLDGDFRYTIDRSDNSVDVLLCLEVLEHIKDQDSDKLDELVTFNASGARAFASEMFRILRPGGTLVLTTPNPLSLFSLTEILANRPPMIFRPHVREYTPEEVIELATGAGFKTKRWQTMNCFFNLFDRAPLLEKFFTSLGASAEHRGDDGFYIFEKPH